MLLQHATATHSPGWKRAPGGNNDGHPGGQPHVPLSRRPLGVESWAHKPTLGAGRARFRAFHARWSRAAVPGLVDTRNPVRPRGPWDAVAYLPSVAGNAVGTTVAGFAALVRCMRKAHLDRGAQ